MNKIGGEIPLQQDNLYSYITDSGRSSLRLILDTLKDKKFALPDFLCPVIIDVFDEMGVEYEFYHVNENILSASLNKKLIERIDILYSIFYFDHQLVEFNRCWGCPAILEDLAFSPFVQNPPNVENWIGFNSLRKISPLTDGSIVRSTIKLDCTRHAHTIISPFAHFKRNGDFERGEKCLDDQIGIYTMSKHSIFALFDFYHNLEDERRERQLHFYTLKQQLKVEHLEINPDFPSFFPILVDKRDELRRWLRQYNIFLPVHWPKHPKAPNNPLYDRIISIPVDSRYTIADMERVAKLINGFYGV